MISAEMRRHSPKTRLRFVDTFSALEDLGDREPSPISALRLLLAARLEGDRRVAYKPVIELQISRNSMGDYVWFGRQKLPGNRTQKLSLQDGIQFVLRAEQKNSIFGPVEMTRIGPNLTAAPAQADQPPHAESSVHLPPGPNYPFVGVEPEDDPQPDSRPGTGPTLLRGTVFRSDGQGMERVRVSTEVTLAGTDAPRQVIYPLTDQTGQWLLPLSGRFSKPLAETSLTLHFKLPDGTSIDVDQVRVVTGRQTSHTQTALRGRVFDERGIGLRNVTITSSSDPDLESWTQEDGSWSLCFPLDRHTSAESDTTITALAADGRTQTRDVRIQPRQIVVVEDIHFSKL